MSVQTKKRFKNVGRIIGILMFATFIFTNIKVAMLEESEISSGNIAILGVDFELFNATIAGTTSDCGGIIYREGPCPNGFEVIGFPCS